MLADHVAANGAEIVVKSGDDQVDLPLGVGFAVRKLLRNNLQHNAALFLLGGDGFELPVLEKGVDHLLTVFCVPLLLQLRLVGLLLQNGEQRHVKERTVERIDRVILAFPRSHRARLGQLFQVEGNRGRRHVQTLRQTLHIHVLERERFENLQPRLVGQTLKQANGLRLVHALPSQTSANFVCTFRAAFRLMLSIRILSASPCRRAFS